MDMRSRFSKPVGVGLMSPEGRLMPGLKTGAASFANGFVAWRADSRHLLAAAIPGALDASVWLIGTEGDEPLRKVAEFPATMRIRGMAVSPDGAFAILGRYQPSSDIVLFTVR